MCARCSNYLHDTYYDLLPSNDVLSCHVVCPVCFGALHAARGCNSTFACPATGCNNKIIGHCCFSPSVEKNIDGTLINTQSPIPGPTTYHAEPDKNIDAVRLYLDRSLTFQKEHIVISTSHLSESNKELRTVSVEVPYNDHCEEYNDELQNKLLAISKVLYHIIVYPMELYNTYRQSIQIDTISKFEEFALSDRSFYVRFLIRMWTGMSETAMLPLGVKSNVNQRSNYLAIYTGVEQLMRSITVYPGVLQSVVQRLLNNQNVSKTVSSALCKLRISASRETVRLENIDKVNEQLTKGWDLVGKKFWLTFVMFDNLGFRILGAKAGYDQYIVVAVVFISSKQLQEIGLYRHPESPEPPISRIRQSWETIRGGYEPSAIVPSQKEYTALGYHMYAHIDALLQISNDIPTVEQARALMDAGGPIAIETKLPHKYGSERRIDFGRMTPMFEAAQKESFEEEELDAYRTDTLLNQEGQQIELDVPIHADLNKKKSVENLSKGSLRLRQRILNVASSVEDPNTNERPIMEDHGIPQGCDGSPAFAFHTLKEQNPVDYDDTHLHAGPFHKHLKTLNSIGTMFCHTHLWHCLHGHRDTDPKKEFFLFPSDPGQTLHELPEMTAPHYVAAMRNLSAMKQGEPISAVNVHDFMLERALEHDHCMIILMWLHFVEVSNIIRDSEGINDPELYRSGATLAMLLFAKTHSTKYIRIGFAEFIWWQTSSEADKKLYDNFYFTKKTAVGKAIWFDRFVEWINKDIRKYLGKYKKPNQELLMTRTALLMKGRLQSRKEEMNHNQSRHQQRHCDRPIRIENDIAVSPIFCYQLDLIYAHNYWGDGPVLVGEYNCIESTSFSDPSGDNALNPNILFDVSNAEEALKIMFQEVYLAEPSERKKPKDFDSSFKKTVDLVKDLKEIKKDEVCRLTSTNETLLKNVTTVDYIKARVKLFRDTYDFISRVEKPHGRSPSKDEWTKYLSRCHSKIIQKFPNYVAETTARVDISFSNVYQGYASPEEKKVELSKPFYTFTDKAKEEFLQRKHSVNPDPFYQTLTLDIPPQTPVRRQRANVEEVTPQVNFARLSLI